MARSNIAVVVLLVFPVCSCSTLRVSHDYDPQADFSRLRTYTWLEHPPDPVADPRVNIELFETRLERAVNRRLEEKGYVKVEAATETEEGQEREAEEADFFVGYFITLDRKVDVNVVDNYHGYGWMQGPRVYVDEYDEGTLILDIVDAKTSTIIWRGIAMDRVDFLADPEERQERLQVVVDKILKRFPPTKE